MSEDSAAQATTESAPLRRGWTTGACAAAATRAAAAALLGGTFPDPVPVALPRDRCPAFSLAHQEAGPGWARAGVIKDAGDDPDVTHGALVSATAHRGAPGTGVVLRAGAGVGIARKPGLPVPPGQPAINPEPRRYIEQAAADAAAACGQPPDLEVTLAIADGARLAAETLNPRLGIEGGLSVLGTTGVLEPFSCAAWIDAIQRGVDVARARGHQHIAATTGRTSEAAAREQLGLPAEALIDMGDFAGGLLKYLRRHPVPRLTLAGGVGKLTKLAQGFLDLHAHRSRADHDALARLATHWGASAELGRAIREANTVAEAFAHARDAGIPLGDAVARHARATARSLLRDAPVAVAVRVLDRSGATVGAAEPDDALDSAPADAPSPRMHAPADRSRPPRPVPLLLLGGTREGRALAQALEDDPHVTALYAIAGRTAAPALPRLPVHRGGFGGADGLAAFLRRGGIPLLIDATHPFAARISANAAAAAARTGTELLILDRPPWTPAPDERWERVPDAAAAAEALAALAPPRRVLLTIGSQEVAAFRAAPQHTYLIRCLVPPEHPPPHAELLRAAPGADTEAERRLIRHHGVEALVTKNAGGAALRPKLDAGRAEGIPVVVIDRPPRPGGVPAVERLDDALGWLRSRLHAREVIG